MDAAHSYSLTWSPSPPPYIFTEFAAASRHRQLVNFITASSSTHSPSPSPSHLPETFGFYAVTRLNPLFVEDSCSVGGGGGGDGADSEQADRIEIARIAKTDGAGTVTGIAAAVANNDDRIHDLDDRMLPVTKRDRGFFRNVSLSARITRRGRGRRQRWWRRRRRRWSSPLRSSADQVDVGRLHLRCSADYALFDEKEKLAPAAEWPSNSHSRSKRTESPLPRQNLCVGGDGRGQHRHRKRRTQRARPHRFRRHSHRRRWSHKRQQSVNDEAVALPLPRNKRNHSRRPTSELIAATSRSRITTRTSPTSTSDLSAHIALRRVRRDKFGKRSPSAKSTTTTTTWPPPAGSLVIFRRRRRRRENDDEATIANRSELDLNRRDSASEFADHAIGERLREPKVTRPSSHLSFSSAVPVPDTRAGRSDISVFSDCSWTNNRLEMVNLARGCGNGVRVSRTAASIGTRIDGRKRRISPFCEFRSSLFLTNSNLVCVAATTAVAGAGASPLQLIDLNVVRIPADAKPPQLQSPSHGYAVDQLPDFTLDAHQAEKVVRKIEDERKNRCWCRIISCCIGFAFLLFSLTLFSMVITRGEKLFGPLQSIY